MTKPKNFFNRFVPQLFVAMRVADRDLCSVRNKGKYVSSNMLECSQLGVETRR